MSLNEFLKKNDLHLTLINEQGEKYEAGAVDYVKMLKSKAVLRWTDEGSYKNVFPFTCAVLHGKRDIFEALHIRPLILGNESVIELVY